MSDTHPENSPAAVQDPPQEIKYRGNKPKQVVLVEMPGGWISELPTLRRSSLQVTHVPQASQAVDLCRSRHHDLVVVSFPMPDMHLDEFVTSLREGRPPSAQPHIVVLAKDRALETLIAYADESLTFISSDLQQAAIETSLMELFNEPTRRTARLMARFEAKLKTGPVLRLCQTVDISRTGMLVQTQQLLPIGASVALEITLDDDEPVVIEAEVVRHAKEAAVGRGMGLRFTRFQGNAKARLVEFLSQPGERR